MRRTSCFLGFYFGQQVKAFFFPPWKGDCSYFDQFTHLVVVPCSVCYSYNYVTCTGCQIGLPITARCSIQMQCVLSLACFSAGFIHKDIVDLSCASFCLVSFAPLAHTHIYIDFSLPCYFKHHLSVLPAVMIMLSLNCTGACICRSWLKHDRQGSAANSEYFSYKWPSPMHFFVFWDVHNFENCSTS